jgi:hypothetical protein
MTASAGPGGVGHAGGSGPLAGVDRTRCVHADLVRTVALGDEFVLSGSYDLSIKVRTYFIPFCIRDIVALTRWPRYGRGQLGSKSPI